MKKKTFQLKNITPQSMQCGAFGCPAIYETEDDGYVIIGKIVDKTTANELKNAVSKGEIAVTIPKKLLKGIKTK